MKAKFMNNTIAFLKKYNTYSDYEIEKLEYGIEGVYLTFTKLIFIFIAAMCLGIVLELIALLFFFNVIRYTGFGFHAEKSYQCLIFSSLCFLLIPLLFINLELSRGVYIVISCLCIISYLLFAPADTVKRPLPNKKKRIIRKVITIIIGIIYAIFSIIYFNSWISPVLISALILQAIVINPLVYMLFKQPYNNYKNYKSD
ncbi:MAG: accessory gene regulator B family protein [bacterium]|nr:accessory gene regulator B family protein [bacterium]